MRAQEMHNFDTYKFIQEFKEAGFKEEQAKKIVNFMTEVRNTDISHLATKEQLEHVEERILNKIEVQIKDSQISIIKWNIGTILAVAGLIVAILKFLPH
jgi:hypothetical protein